jgi:hypothetical protein
MLRFSIKEAVYKALNPVLHRYISFLEVEVEPNLDGSADIKFLTLPPKNISEGCENTESIHTNNLADYKIEGFWRKIDNFWITCAFLTKIDASNNS